jgi:glycosyltransferase involved in cell wall biosynthesis
MNQSINMKHVCIITYHMIPHTNIWGASQRIYYLSKHLKENGYDVTVMHASFGLFETDKTIDYKTIPIEIKPGFLQKYQNRLQQVNTSSDLSENPKRKKIFKIIFKAIYHFLEKIFFNDFGGNGFLVFMWNKQAWLALKKLFADKQPAIFIVSGPYFGTFSLVEKIKNNFPNTKIIIDYRDPWNLLKKGSIYTNYKEKKYIDLCDKISFFSEKFSVDMCRQFLIKPEKCLTVYNGYDSILWDKVENSTKPKEINDKMVLSYVGSHIIFERNNYRDPSNLLNAVTNFENAQDLIVNFVGCHDKPKNFEVKTKAQINFISTVSHRKALEYMNSSDVLIVLTTNEYPSKYIVTGKLFDCIRSGAFILGIANDSRVDYIQIIERLGIGAYCKNNEDEIRKSLNIIYEKWVNKSLNYFDLIDRHRYSRRYQNNKFINSIKHLK